MPTCPKCFKPNPDDAAFCGFCGASMAESHVAPGGAKTVFGYSFDPSQVAPQAAEEAPAAPEKTSEAPASKVKGEVATAPTDEYTPLTESKKLNDTPAEAAEKPGIISGKYTLVEQIRRLPTGKLFRARDIKQQDAEIDLLLVDKSVFTSPLDVERARRELRQIQKLDCPSIIKILDHAKTDNEQLYVVMELADGDQLDKLVAQKPMSLAESQRVIKGVGSGLAEAQKMGVIHRDIAPHNVIICTDGTIKVRGFGLAAPVKKHVFGTAEFLSPEQASARPVDQRSNIYSLGALMYFMLTGQPPFVADSPEELLTKHQKEEPVSPTVRKPDLDLPARAETLVLKALSKSSSRRHLTLRQFLREVESLVATTAPQTAPAAPEKAMSFETPLHGVTALKGGKTAPHSTAPGLDTATTPDVSSETMPDMSTADRLRAATGQSTNQPSSVPGSPASFLPADQLAKTMMAPGSRPAASAPPAAASAPPAAASAPPAAASAPPAAITVSPDPVEPMAPTIAPESADMPMEPSGAPATKLPAHVATGEVRSDVALKEPEHPAVGQEEQVAGLGVPPTRPPVSAPAGSGGFRETMWFFKGEVESQMAAEGEEQPVQQEGVEASPEELAAKYRDDGSLSEEEARRLSLRTGKTQMMQNVRIPSGQVPGERMADEDFITEMNRGTRIAIWIGVFLVLAGIGALVAWLIMS